MHVGDVLLYTLYRTLGYTPAEIRMTCVQSDAVMVAARFSTLFHQLWSERVESVGAGCNFENDEERHTYFLMNVDPCSCILGYKSVAVKVDTLAIQTVDGWTLTLCDDILGRVLATLTAEYPDVQYAGYVSYRWLGDDGERFNEFEISSGDNIPEGQTYGLVASLLSTSLKKKCSFPILRERLDGASETDRFDFGEAVRVYQKQLYHGTYDRLVALV